MRVSVAFLLILATFSSAALTQTPARRSNQSGGSKPAVQTMTICQGVPLPPGYVIVAYLTSSACPHGAYVLKKQTDYETSLAVSNAARSGGNASTAASNSSESSGSPFSATGTKVGKKVATRANAGNTPAVTRSQPSGDSEKDLRASPNATRVRRVGSQAQSTSQPAADAFPSEGPPTLIGSARPGPMRPPTLTNRGDGSAPSATLEPSDAAAPSGPEEVSEGDVIRVNTTLISVPVSVLDRQGRFVSNLKREDFSIFENGVEQSIAYFEPAEMPFTVALVLDTSPSTHFHLSEIKQAAIEFAKKLRPQDRVLVVSFNHEVLLLTPATNDFNVIEAVIDENANMGDSTRLYDAVDLTITEQLNKIKGRKAIVLFTDGVDTSSQQASYNSTLREVEELDALIYPIQYDSTDYLRAMQNAGSGGVTVVSTTRGPFGTTTSRQVYGSPINGGLPLPGSTKEDYARADHYLRALADKTGGRLYEANDTPQLAQAFAAIAEELRRQYSLGYYPKADAGDVNGPRQIRVKVQRPDVGVKARVSYTKRSAAPAR